MTTGTKFSKNVRRLRRENEMLAGALEPILEMRAKLSAAGDSHAVAIADEVLQQLEDSATL